MPSLADLLENYRNWKGRQDWQSGKEMQDYFGGDPVAQEQFDRLSGFGTADLGGLSGLAGAIKASHGSPHAFEKFDVSKMGSGEGSQAFGHGLYFGEGFDSPIAKTYAAIANRGGSTQYGLSKEGRNLRVLDSIIRVSAGQHTGGDVSALGELVKKHPGAFKDPDALISRIGEYKDNRAPEYLYNAELKWPDAAREASDPLGEHHLLSWEESISKQPEHVKAAIQNINKELIPQLSAKEQKYTEQFNEDMPAGMWYQTLARTVKPESLSKGLYEQNVPGLKYLDQGSRSSGEGTRNYVMFNDQFPEIVSRNGVSLSDLLRR